MLRHFLGSRLAPPAAGLHEWRCIAELRHALPSNQASRSTYIMGTTLMPSLAGPCCSSTAHVQPPVPARTTTRAFAAAGVPSSPSGPSAAGSLAVQQLGLRLPERCCGCGINLQQTDPEAPGYFIVPAKLLEMAAERQGTPSTSDRRQHSDEDEDGADYELSRRELEAEIGSRSRGNDDDDDDGLPDVICQRCYSLKYQGKVKVEAAEGQLPDFDLGKKVGRKIFLQKDRRAVVLCVVDVWDFDGSLPRLALQSLYPPGTGAEPPDNLKFKLMVAVNKCDLLPTQATFGRVNQWVRSRMKQAGLPRPDKVFLVSAAKGTGVRELVEDVKAGLGFRGDLWVVGAQNAGKSSLISSMKRLAGTSGKREPTIAPMPGTTLGLLNVPGLPLGPKHRAFDTPGVPHTYQLTSRLTLEELKAVLPSKQLRGRTYRIGAGNTLLIAGLARLDIVSTPAATIYLTVFVSNWLNLHMGKTEGAAERQAKHVGGLLAPPLSVERAEQLPALEPTDLTLDGESWEQSSVDVAIAGLGWVSIGCKGKVDLRVWAYPGVSITCHDPLVPEYAKVFERPGFSTMLPKTAGKGAKSNAKGGQ